jgi:hypothetical protein
MVRSEGNMSLKNPVTPPGNDPGTVRLLAQRLNHYATPDPGPFHVRFQKRFRNFKYGNGQPKFAQHLLNNKHFIGSMEDIMGIFRITKKGSMMNTL